jgi:transcriptional regulator with XRE-family HTH domain
MPQKESNAIDGYIDQIVKARWLAMGLSQTDLAEVLGLTCAQMQKDDQGPDGAAHRLQLADVLNIPVDFFHRPAGETRQEDPDFFSIEPLGSLQTLLALRLLRAFHELTDQGAREMLVQLAEQIVKRQADRR